MKKVYLLVLFLVPFISAQQNNGSISLVYNGEKIDMPINSVTIHKENGILLGIKAEQTKSGANHMVALELGFKELSAAPDAETLEGTRIRIITKNISDNSGKELSVRFSDDNDKSEAYYGISEKGEKQSWGITSVSLKINITDVKYAEGALHISGECNGTFGSKEAPEGEIAEIKDGRFEIII